MNKPAKVIALALTAAVAGIAVSAAVAAPADAASSRGSASYSEAKTLAKQMNKQRCLTVKESKKIVHGKGYTDKARYTFVSWDASKGSMHDGVTVMFIKGCAKEVRVDYEGATEYWDKGSKKMHVDFWE